MSYRKRFFCWLVASLLLGLSCWEPAVIAAPLTDPVARAQHAVDRLSFGPRPGDLERVMAQGVEAYIQEQLEPETQPLPLSLERQLERFKTLKLDPVPLMQRREFREGDRRHIPQQEARQARVLLAVRSPRQLEEVMADFWFNHFNVDAGKGLARLWVWSYERDALRPHAFGHFRDLLEATARHPAMSIYLDNWLNTAPGSPGARGQARGLNENYARELLELHTLGVDGGYSQADVRALARILTGWGSLPARKPFRFLSSDGFQFDGTRHDWGEKVFLGYTIAGLGEEEVERVLDILARHPSTARFISTKLAQYFVADNPPISLIERLSTTFNLTDGNIRAVLATLFSSPEFWDDRFVGQKFKTPYQYVIASLRSTATDTPPIKGVSNVLHKLGMPLYRCATPDGWDDAAATWMSPENIVRRVSFATALSQGRFRRGRPVNPDRLQQTLGATRFSERTQTIVDTSPRPLRAALLLGSPEMMYR